jgi:transcriptional regulator with XRE-family HTH domain
VSFGEQLRALRERAQLTQAALAEKAGLSLWSLQSWEQGRKGGGSRGPSAPVLVRLANALDVSLETLLKAIDTPAMKSTLRRGRPPRKK